MSWKTSLAALFLPLLLLLASCVIPIVVPIPVRGALFRRPRCARFANRWVLIPSVQLARGRMTGPVILSYQAMAWRPFRLFVGTKLLIATVGRQIILATTDSFTPIASSPGGEASARLVGSSVDSHCEILGHRRSHRVEKRV